MDQHSPGPTLADISNSVAYTILDDLESRGVLTSLQVQAYKTKYAQLHEIVLETYENEKVLLAKAKQMNLDWIERKKKLDKKISDRMDFTDKIQDLKTHLEQRSAEVANLEEQGGLHNYELEELERTKADLVEDMELRRKESETLTLPVLERLRNNIREMQAEIVAHEDATQKEAKFKEEYGQRLVQLKADTESLEKEKYQYQVELNRAKINPERIRSQIEMSQKAITGLTGQGQFLSQEIEKLNEEYESINNEKKKVGSAQLEAMFNLEKIRKEVWKAERTLNETTKQLENEKIRYQEKLSQKLELETSNNHMKSQIRMELNHVGKLKKTLEELKRRYEKTRRKRDAINSVIGPLRDQWIAQGHQLSLIKAQTKDNLAAVEELQADIDILISQFLREEKTDSIAESKLKEYREINANLEEGLRHSMKKERELKTLIRDMSSKRDVISRDTAKAAGDYKALKEELKVKDLIILDLTKKVSDVKARLQECSVMYDLIKNQRNKFANLTQACNQEFAEMKEKIRILQSEIEILRAESAAKEKSLADETRVLQTAQTTRDAMKLDQSKLRMKFKAKKVESERQQMEIKKLNQSIATTEKEMIRMRASYAKVVEGRNSTGMQLVDRNDELCILHEKSNILESMLKTGEKKLSEIDEDLRRSNLEIEELNRQIRVAKANVAGEKQIAALQAEIAGLTAKIADRRQHIAELSEKLETPSACHRHRVIPGEDLDINQLNSKIEVLQDILNDKKEQLLEKDLVLEEVGTLSDALKIEAAEGHDKTASLANELNLSQDIIRKLRRKMMATVSELSMYQATVLRMEKEKQDKEAELAESQNLLERGLAPSEAVEHEWYRMERERIRRREELLHPERVHPNDFRWRQQEGKLKSMADPRPNAYVCEELGIPKPYGGNAPFKPSLLGANLRHIQKPKIREIII